MSPPPQLVLPHNFTPRRYQLPVLRAFDRGIRRFCWVVHRRAGKDKTFFNLMVREAAAGRVGNYWYVFPTYTQARKSVWDAIDGDSFRVRDHAPRGILAKDPNESEMSLQFTSGSTLQLIGSDKIDALVGTNPVGVVFSEYALQSPSVWPFLSPILVENGGWAAFLYTPRGTNHGLDLYNRTRADPAWFTQLLTVDDTGALSPAQLAAARSEMSEEVFRQEYYCDWLAGQQGAYYARLLARAQDEGRITRVPADPRLPVHTSWDLGVGDSTAIWFWQVGPGGERRFIDYYEASGEGLPHYARLLSMKTDYTWGRHFAPHDIEVREFSSGMTRIEAARSLGIRFDVVPRQALEDGIEASRLLLPRAWFDAERCKQGIEALRSYHKEYDEARRTWRDRPEHDWSSHGADAFRYGALARVETPHGSYTKAEGRRDRPW